MQHIYITSDHAGYDLKEKISFELSKNKNLIILVVENEYEN